MGYGKIPTESSNNFNPKFLIQKDAKRKIFEILIETTSEVINIAPKYR